MTRYYSERSNRKIVHDNLGLAPADAALEQADPQRQPSDDQQQRRGQPGGQVVLTVEIESKIYSSYVFTHSWNIWFNIKT